MVDLTPGDPADSVAPALWLDVPDTPPAGLGAGASGPGMTCLRVTARTREEAGAGSAVELLGTGATRGGLLARFRRSDPDGVSMEAFLADLGGRTNLAVVPSDGDNALGVVAEARRLGMLERLWITSADLGVLETVRADSPATRLLHTCDPTGQPQGAERHAAALREREIQGVMVPNARVGAGLVALMHRFGRLVGSDGARYARMVRAGALAGADIVCGPSADALTEGLGT